MAEKSATQIMAEHDADEAKLRWMELKERFERGAEIFSREDMGMLIRAMERMLAVLNTTKGSQ